MQDKSIDLKFVSDVDEVCLLFCGHIAWAKHSKSIQKQGPVAHDNKQDKSYRKACSLTPVGAAMVKVLEPVVVGKDDDFGIDEDSGRKLRQLRAYEVPGLGKLGDF